MSTRLLLSSQYLAPGQGGIATVARMTVMSLAPRHRMVALACQDKADHSVAGVKVRAFGDNRAAFVVANFVESLRADRIIYDFAGTARAQLPFAAKPYAVWIHGIEMWEGAPAKYLKAARGAALLLCNSHYTRDRAASLLSSGANVSVCELGTVQDEAPQVLPAPGHPPTVLLLGRVDELFGKGHDILIDVWPQVISAVPDARLVFAGGGPTLNQLQAMVNRSSARASITVTGFVAEEALDQLWRQADIFAMLGDAEGFGLVYADAMRYGLPVIASREDAGQEVNVDGKTGYNISRADKTGLTDALVSLLRDRDRAARLGAAGQARWRTHYRFSVFRERLLAAMQDFLP